MEPILKQKRQVASLVPYRRTSDGYEFYLQKRGTNTQVNPGLFGIFGGGLEGSETPGEGMLREIREELTYTPVQPVYFSRYEAGRGILSVFIEEVGSDFEVNVTVAEGEYGRFLKTEEILFAPDVSVLSQLIIQELIRDFLEKK